MRFGKYKGKHFDDVPASYLMWLYNDDIKGPVRDYIERNMDGIKKQIADGNGDV
jgi:uncharacterized protein (DUF3820 family)